MCVGRKPHPFGNERHTIACGLSTIMLFTEILEGRYFPRERGRPKFDDIGKTVVTIMRCTGNVWNFAKVVIVDSVFCVTNGLRSFGRKEYLELRSLRSVDTGRQISRVVQSIPNLLQRMWVMLMQLSKWKTGWLIMYFS